MAAEGVETRHRQECGKRNGKTRCTCVPSYRAQVYDKTAGKAIRKTFASEAAAKTWRHDAAKLAARGELSSSRSPRFEDAVLEWLRLVEGGGVLSRRGKPFPPSTLGHYRAVIHARLIPEFGDRRLDQITRSNVLRYVERLLAAKLAPNTVRNIIAPMQGVYRHALDHKLVSYNPTTDLRIPTGYKRRERFATPAEAAALLEALTRPGDRARWALAFYAGMRRSEVLGLTWERVNLSADGGLITVSQTYDYDTATYKDEAKSAAGTHRQIPVAGALRAELLRYQMSSGNRTGLLFTSIGRWSTLLDRAREACKRAGIEPILFHEGRHTYAALSIAAGIPPKTLQTYMGHSSISMTLDRYGHLYAGSEQADAAKLDAYLQANV